MWCALNNEIMRCQLEVIKAAYLKSRGNKTYCDVEVAALVVADETAGGDEA
jgi:hypothetical protein